MTSQIGERIALFNIPSTESGKLASITAGVMTRELSQPLEPCAVAETLRSNLVSGELKSCHAVALGIMQTGSIAKRAPVG